MAIRLLVIDDHEVVRLGLRKMLADANIEIIGEGRCGNEAAALIDRLKPDVVLMDVRMTEGDGLYTLGRLKLDIPELPILIFSAYDNPGYIARAVALGASGYLLKDSDRQRIVDVIELVARGGTSWSKDELRKVTGALATPRLKNDVDVPLTQKESEVLRQMALGLTNKEIAKSMDLSYETVKEHVQHILRKIGVTDRTQAAVWAVRHSLV